MSNFDRAFTELLGNEGGYSDDPQDPGGETMWGVTARVARAHGYLGPMKDMPQEVAKTIYRAEYWPAGLDQLSYPVAFQVFDGTVNSGIQESVKWLQAAAGVKQDGDLGAKTIAAVRAMDAAAVVGLFNAIRLRYMTGLVNWEHDGKGWARRISNNLMQALSNA